jgi:hypothetical protein
LPIFTSVDSSPRTNEITTEASNQYAHADELPKEPPIKVVDKYISVLKSDEFQAALTEVE